MPPEVLPLSGRRVLVTRTRDQAAALSASLAALGAEPVELPVVQAAPVRDPAPLDAAIARLASGAYEWVTFSSANGVRHFVRRLRRLGYSASALAHVRIAVVGPTTAAALAEHGLAPSLLPERISSEGVLAAFAAHHLTGRPVLVLRAAAGRDVLAAGLRQRGAQVDEVTVYELVPVAEGAAAVAAALQAGTLDAVTFTSGAIVRSVVEGVARAAGVPRAMVTEWLRRPVVVCLGRTASDACSALGIDVHLVADTPTIESLVSALVQALAGSE